MLSSAAASVSDRDADTGSCWLKRLYDPMARCVSVHDAYYGVRDSYHLMVCCVSVHGADNSARVSIYTPLHSTAVHSAEYVMRKICCTSTLYRSMLRSVAVQCG